MIGWDMGAALQLGAALGVPARVMAEISDIEHEDVPMGKKRHRWLEVVYDAFNEMCDKYK